MDLYAPSPFIHEIPTIAPFIMVYCPVHPFQQKTMEHVPRRTSSSSSMVSLDAPQCPVSKLPSRERTVD